MANPIAQDNRAIGEPVPLGVIDVAQQTIGVPEQTAREAEEELSALRGELAALQLKISEAATKVGKGVKRGGREVLRTADAHPLTSLAIAFLSAVAAGFVATKLLESPPPRSRTQDFISDLRRKIRDRI